MKDSIKRTAKKILQTYALKVTLELAVDPGPKPEPLPPALFH